MSLTAIESVSLSSLGGEMELRIKQGATFGPYEVQLTYEETGLPVDITGCGVRCELRRKGLDTGPPSATVTATVIDAVNGKYQLGLLASQTAAIQAGELISSKLSHYTFDIFLDWPGGTVWELAHGNAFCFRQVTKS
jgi:hypothetical protein